MKKLKDKIENFNQINYSKLFYEFGSSPEEIKCLIIEAFQDYFHNTDNLKENTSTGLTSIWFSFLSLQKNSPDTIIFIGEILNIYNFAKEKNKEETFEAYAKWFPDFSQSITRFWSVYFGQKKYDELDDEDFLAEILQLIGQSIEGVAKPYLHFTLYLNRLKRAKPADINEIKGKDLGIVIDELNSTSDLGNLLTFNGIRLNQWRNIAYHHNTKIVNGKMFYYLKKNGVTEEFETSREELGNVARFINNFFKIIRIAETIFFVDNLGEIQEQIDLSDTSQVNFRIESDLLNFNNAISSLGFTISNLEFDETIAVLDLVDMELYSDIVKKAIHSSQFLYNLWGLTKSKKLKVNYHLNNGIKFFTSEITSTDFENKSHKEIPFNELMKNVEYTYINKEIRQVSNPFDGIVFSEEIINNSPQFYSQKGEKISLLEFSKQFILTIFCNYLVLKAEEFEDIRINIGSDGSMVRAEKPTPIVLMVPATIKNKAHQLKLIEILDTTLQLYESTLLTMDVINEARDNNDYYRKIAMVKLQKNDLT